MSKLDIDRHKQTVRVFWKSFKWFALFFFVLILSDILGDGFRPILSKSRAAQVAVEDKWTQWIDSLYSFFEVVSKWIMLAVGAGVLVALLIGVLVWAIRQVFFK